ncbi:protein of unknown function [Legionella micdadei]|uniref:Superfamily I DNA or RNA helicase n=6 Tax=Legionella micdadei TaxID=451 RepID=A0A098GEF0_LEGMI|nr:hypothetical protein [Legionella micdadei]KTD26618.1 hypothetical protein Lmic_2712 [Legionella micdadei]CEG60355.1 protein of unknown function [Legionella micdadei]SCY72869.1 Superfamily I DNA or RNA helicase [Legionella micdadei]
MAPGTIHYWQGLIGDEEKLEEYKPIIEKLVRGEYKSLGLEWIVKPYVYSVRASQGNRLLFANAEVKGHPYILFLKDIGHQYHRSPFVVIPGYCERYLEKYRHYLEEVLEQSGQEEGLVSNLQGNKEGTGIKWVGLEYYNQNFIELNSKQEEALKAKLPLLVSGPPGSGKSCVSLFLMNPLLNGLPLEGNNGVLYVTQSSRLVEQMQRGSAEGLPAEAEGRVGYQSYESLARVLHGEELAGKTLVDKEEFAEWFRHYVSKKQEELKARESTQGWRKGKLEELKEKGSQVYQEFRILSGYDEAGYLSLGGKQSIFHDSEEKGWIYAAYEAYQIFLKSEKKVDLAFFPFVVKGRYEMVVVDESQDLSYLQLRNLLELAKAGQVCLCIDTRQSLNDSKSKRPYIVETLRKMGYEVSHIELPFSHRCPEVVVPFLNNAVGIRNVLTGGSDDKLGQSKITGCSGKKKAGSIRWVEGPDEETLKFLHELAKTTQFAVVTQAEYVEEARKLYKTEMVFTVEQIKGLEFRTVVAHKILEPTELLREADDILEEYLKVNPDVLLDKSKAAHRAKKGQGDERFGPPMNQFFTACSRATEHLIINQKRHHALRHLYQLLGVGLPNKEEAQEVTFAVSTKTEEELRREWLSKAIDFVKQGLPQAREIYIHKLGHKPEEFEAFRKEHEIKLASVVNPVADKPGLKNTQAAEQSPAQEDKRSKKSKKKKKRTKKLVQAIAIPQAVRRAPVLPQITSSSSTAVSLRQAGNSAFNLVGGSTFFSSKPQRTPEEYVQGLFNSLTESNLKLFFACDEDKLFRYLFTVPMPDGECLFRHILLDSNKMNVFVSFLDSNPENYYKFSGERFSKPIPGHPDNLTPLELLVTTGSVTGGTVFLTKHVFPHNPFFYLKLSVKQLLCPPDRDWERIFNAGNFFLRLMATKEKCELLKLIMETDLYEELCKPDAINGNNWFQWCAEKELFKFVKLIMKNPLFDVEILKKENKAGRTLESDLESMPKLKEMMKTKAEVNKGMSKSERLKKHFMNYMSDDLLSNLLSLDLAAMCKKLFTSLNFDPDKDEYFLTTFLEDKERAARLEALISKQQRWNKFHGEMFSQKIPGKSITPFEVLFNSQDGQCFLEKILLNESLFKYQLEPSLICPPYQNWSEHREKNSPLYRLCTSTFGNSVFGNEILNEFCRKAHLLNQLTKKDNEGNTWFHWALENSLDVDKIIPVFLQARQFVPGIDNVRNNKGYTILELAQIKIPEIVFRLQGCKENNSGDSKVIELSNLSSVRPC